MQVLLLQAALGSGTTARRAYDHWRAQVDLNTIDVASQRVLPLLVRNPDLEGEADDVLDRCRKVARFTWLKTRVLVAEAAGALAVLQRAGIPVMLVKGAAVVHHSGGDLATRPMDDVDVAVPAALVGPAVEALAEDGHHVGLAGATSEELDAWQHAHHGVAVTGSRGAEVDLHWHAIAGSLHPEADQALWAAAVPADLGGIRCLATSREDTIVAVIAGAMHSGGTPGLRWATDTVALVTSAPGGVDWPSVAATARSHRVGVAVADALDVLRRVLGLEVPRAMIRELRHATLAEHAEMWSHLDRKGHHRLPGPLTTIVAAYQRDVRCEVHPGRRPALRDAARFFTHWWDLGNGAAVAAHAVFVGARRPWRLRWRLFGATPERAELHFRLGQPVDFTLGGGGHGALGSGWSAPEAHGTWSTGAEAAVRLRLADPPIGWMSAWVELVPFVVPTRSRRRVDIVVNGCRCARWVLEGQGLQIARGRFRIPPGVVGPAGDLTLRFVVDRPLTPDAARYGADNRPLGVALRALCVDAEGGEEVSPPSG